MVSFYVGDYIKFEAVGQEEKYILEAAGQENYILVSPESINPKRGISEEEEIPVYTTKKSPDGHIVREVTNLLAPIKWRDLRDETKWEICNPKY